jgi:adenylate kinase family enzyme
VRVRFQTYTEATRPLAKFYAERSLLITVSAQGEPHEILQHSLQSLHAHVVAAAPTR